MSYPGMSILSQVDENKNKKGTVTPQETYREWTKRTDKGKGV